MRALCWHGKKDVRCDTVPDPEIEAPRDAIIRVTSCAICGSDLHLYDGFMPGMESGDIMGHEFMGEVVEVGSENKKLKVGDRVVVPFTIVCGECDQCRRGYFSVCERSNRNKEMADKVFGHTTAGLFGYTHLTGGYPGGQAEYVRVPFADVGPVKVPSGLSDEQVLFLGDIFPTGWQAIVQCDIEPTDTVAIWGCGPVGQFCIRSAILLGARQVVAIDRVPERLSMAEAGGAIAIDLEEESVVERLNEITSGKGPEKCIDAVGMAHRQQAFQPRDGNGTLALAQGLGWFSIGLGVAELMAAQHLARFLGMEESAELIRAYGAREIVTGVGILSQEDPTPWMWGRVGGDVLDLGTLAMGLGRDNPQRGNVGLAVAAVAGVMALDLVCARRLGADREWSSLPIWDYSGRRGMPRPPEAMRGVARDFPLPRDMRIPEALRPYPSA